jgi:DNA-binding Lrp family transcriptional regulator
MKSKDLLLLSNLRANSRETLTTISKRTKIPISTIFDKLKNHEKNVIQKHTTIIDFSKLGFSTRATITFKVNKKDKEILREYLVKHYNVNSLYKINNGFDFLIEGIFKNLNDFEDFLEQIDDKFRIKTKQVFYIIEDVKREDFMSDMNYVDLICGEAQ